MDWRVLVVDDLQADDIVEVIQGNKTVDVPDSLICLPCDSFAQAIERLKHERFDLVILDLKNDADHDLAPLAGVTVFDELKKCRFLPVIFHTGYPGKVTELASPYVKVVTRGEDWQGLRATIREVLATRLPRLVRHIEEEQRRFMWESVGNIWAEDMSDSSPSDLAYLLARRLANTLSGDVVRSFLQGEDNAGAPQTDKVHAVELYIFPPISSHILFGDIFKRPSGKHIDYFVALTPSCDHAQGKAEFVLFSKCKLLSSTHWGEQAKALLNEQREFSKSLNDELIKFIQDNSNPKDRYKYLPGTRFLPDLLVDLQCMTTVAPGDLAGYERIASMDSPFAEALQAKLTRYLGRTGTPDLDSNLALKRFKASLQSI